MDIVLLLSSSSRPEPYEVTVSVADDKLSLSCSCPAGEWGKFCKHKTAVVLGNVDALFDSRSAEGLKDAQRWIQRSPWPELLTEIAAAERQAAAATRLAKKTKEKAAKSMAEGVDLGV
ncbi:MAG: hypothetical protein H6982_03360 [Chromatiales bacterium]|nr:hypothetical protein [Chromatiales bacterium]